MKGWQNLLPHWILGPSLQQVMHYPCVTGEWTIRIISRTTVVLVVMTFIFTAMLLGYHLHEPYNLHSMPGQKLLHLPTDHGKHNVSDRWLGCSLTKQRTLVVWTHLFLTIAYYKNKKKTRAIRNHSPRVPYHHIKREMF